jgi:predicted CxxxxCH...CXXCH cytochrome family protein
MVWTAGLGPTTSWNDTTAACSASYCHGAGGAATAVQYNDGVASTYTTKAQSTWGGTLTAPVWTDAGDTYKGCTACHASAPVLSATNPHPGNTTCANCHPAGSAAASLTGNALLTHADGHLDLLRTGCTACHGDPNTDNVLAASPLASAPGYNGTGRDTLGQTAVTTTEVGAHQAHLQQTTYRSASITCDQCHVVPTTNTDVAHATGVGSTNARATITWGNLANGTKSGQANTNPSYVGPTCNSVYCHGANMLDGFTATKLTSWTWNSTVTLNCGSCHGTPPNVSPHTSTMTQCAGCHPAGYSLTAVNATKHMDGVKDFSGCDTCHGDPARVAQGTATNEVTYAPPKSHLTTSTVTAPISQNGVGLHIRHVNDTTIEADQLRCADCHVTADASHPENDGEGDVRWGALANKAGTASWNDTAGSCGTVYCHNPTPASAGTVPVPTFFATNNLACVGCHRAAATLDTNAHEMHVADASYKGTTYGCVTCHSTVSNDTTIANKTIHVDGTAQVSAGGWNGTACGTNACHAKGTETGTDYVSIAWAAGTAGGTCNECHGSEGGAAWGEPRYANVPGNLNLANSHASHVSTVAATAKTQCVLCHSATVNPTTGGIVAGGGSHLNFTQDAVAGGTAAFGYNKTTETCSSISCHGSKSAVWGSALGCADCHGQAGRTANTTVGFMDTNEDGAPPTDLTGSSTSNAVGPHLAHVNPAAATQTMKPISCAECHGAAVNTYQATHSDTVQQVGFTDAAYAKLTGFAATSTSGNPWGCTSYCHGDGFNATVSGSVASWSWNTTQVADCGACHKRPPTDAVHTTLTSRGTTAVTSCNACHNTTVTAAGAIQFFGAGATATTNHIDGTIDTGGLSCTSCHGNPPTTTTQLANWANTNGAGNHTAHSVTLTTRTTVYACGQCHPTWTQNTHASGGAPQMVWTAGLGPTTSWNDTTAACSASYCHGAGGAATAVQYNDGVASTYTTKAQSTWGGTLTAPVWTDAGDTYKGCTACHASAPVLSATNPHPGNTTCANCHPAGSAAASLTGNALLTHADGHLDLLRTGCTACHGDPNTDNVLAASPLASAPGYNGTGRDTLGQTAVTTTEVGAHQAHLQSTTFRSASITCDQCHVVPATNTDVTHATGVGSTNARATLTWGNLANGTILAGPSTNPTYVGPTCNSVYCHGTGMVDGFTATKLTSWTWNSTVTLTCGSCHGTPPNVSPHTSGMTQCGGCHPSGYSLTAVNKTEHIDGETDATGGGPNCYGCHAGGQGGRRLISGDFTKNSHHVRTNTGAFSTTGTTEAAGWGTNRDCVVCHMEGQIITAYSADCATGTLPMTCTNPTYHTNGVIDLRDVDVAAPTRDGASDAANFVYNKSGMPALPADWGSANQIWREWTSGVEETGGATLPTTPKKAGLDRFCLNCHDSNGASQISTFRVTTETSRTATDPFWDGATNITNAYDLVSRGAVIDVKSRVTCLNGANVDLAVCTANGTTPGQPVNGVYSRHAIRGQSTSRYTGANYIPATHWASTTWNDRAVMGCADCHSTDGANGVNGNAHGSGQEYLLKNNAGLAPAEATSANTTDYICYRCHAGAGLTGDYTTGAAHLSGMNNSDYVDSRLNTGAGTANGQRMAGSGNIFGMACMNCHGGFGWGSIHGTSDQIRINAGPSLRNAYRFMNGGSLRYYDPSGWTGTTAQCYTLDTKVDTLSWGACGQHSAGGTGKTPTRDFTRPISY